MKLRTQMLLAGALTLAVPVIGWQSVKQLDQSLRQTRIDDQSLRVANARLSLAESTELQSVLESSLSEKQAADLYAEQAEYPIFVDGYDDDWRHLRAPPMRFDYADHKNISISGASPGMAQVRLRLATHNGRLFIHLRVVDDRVVYHEPPVIRTDLGEEESLDSEQFIANGDAVELLLEEKGGHRRHVIFRAIAPGALAAREYRNASAVQRRLPDTGRELPVYQGFWAATADGYQLEASMPLPQSPSPFAFAVVDVDQNGASRELSIGTLDPQVARSTKNMLGTGRLFYPTNSAAARLKPWVTRGTRARLFDRQGRLIADVNSLYDRHDDDIEYDPGNGDFLNAVLFRVFAYFVADPELQGTQMPLVDGLHLPQAELQRLASAESSTRRYITAERDHVLGTMVPIGGEQANGFLLFESNEDLAAAYSSSRVARLFSLLTLVSLLAGLVLLVFASVLSLRIRRLSQLAQQAVSDDGRVRGLQVSDASDEIGDLSRTLAQLLKRSANYTHYLEALSSRLSHELRTPLSVVKTSIENMDREQLDEQTLTLLDRASGGADQLASIIRALVESTRLEQTVQRASMQWMDLGEWFPHTRERYRQVHGDCRFSLSINGPQQTIMAVASPDLLQQALDKLVDNAVSFSSDGVIRLCMDVSEGERSSEILVSVHNHGPAIPDELLVHAFDPMYSSRPKDTGELHLGLGLYIVRMIAEAHRGRAVMRNLDDGVLVGFVLPLAEKAR